MSIAPDQASRFHQKREEILDAGSALINKNGANGMTFVDVAEMVNLNTTSVTYHFKRKKLLATAALEHSLGRLEAQVEEAGSEVDPRARVAAYFDLHFAMWRWIRRREERPITILSDMRALEEPLRTELTERWSAIFRKVRGFFGPATSEEQKRLNTARANVLIENMFWLPAWLPRYSTGDFGRVRHRLYEIFDRGYRLRTCSLEPLTADDQSPQRRPRPRELPARRNPADECPRLSRLLGRADRRGTQRDEG